MDRLLLYIMCAIGIMFDKKTHISKCLETDSKINFKQVNLMIFFE